MSEKSATQVDRWAAFRGLSWWQLVFALAPLVLIAGGLIGGLLGGAAAWINLKIARKPWHAVTQIGAMIAVGGAAFLLYLMLVGAFVTAIS